MMGKFGTVGMVYLILSNVCVGQLDAPTVLGYLGYQLTRCLSNLVKLHLNNPTFSFL